MGLLELLSKIEATYINNLPDIKGMENLAITIGCTVEYKHGFCARWWHWLCFNDCEYVLNRNNDDTRNYTA